MPNKTSFNSRNLEQVQYKYTSMDEIIENNPVFRYIASEATLELVFLFWDLSIAQSTRMNQPINLFNLQWVKDKLKRQLARDLRKWGEYKFDLLMQATALKPKKKTKKQLEEEEKALQEEIIADELDESKTEEQQKDGISQKLSSLFTNNFKDTTDKHLALLFDAPETTTLPSKSNPKLTSLDQTNLNNLANSALTELKKLEKSGLNETEINNYLEKKLNQLDETKNHCCECARGIKHDVCLFYHDFCKGGTSLTSCTYEWLGSELFEQTDGTVRELSFQEWQELQQYLSKFKIVPNP